MMIIVMISSIILFQCDKNNLTAPDENNFDVSAFGMIEVDEADIELMTNEGLAKAASTDLRAYEVRLKYFAKGIAKLLNDPEIGAYLKDEIGKQFDGDYDALWETIAEKEFAQKGKFKNILKGLYQPDIDMIAQFNSVPLLQVSAPVHFDKWDVDEPLLVAYDPITKDDMEWEEIEAFDTDGKKYKMDAKSAPDFPVIVVGLNERINPTTGKFYSFADTPAGGHTILAKAPPGGGGGNGGGGSSYDLRIVHFRLMDDHEPWYKGDAEIYTKTREFDTSESWTTTHFTHVNKEVLYLDENHTWLPKTIYTTGINGRIVKVKIWEDDWGNNDDLVEEYYDIVQPGYGTSNPSILDYPRWFYGYTNDADVYIQTF